MIEDRFIQEMTDRLRREELELGHLVAAIGYKRALVDRLGLERALQACRQHLNVPGLDVLKCRKVVSLKSAAERSEVFREVWPGGQSSVHALARVLGEGDHVELRGTSRSGYLTCLEEVTIRGRSAVVMTETEAIVDFENGELESFEDSPEYDPGILHAAGGNYWTMDPRGHSNVVDEAFMLTGSHTNDFGHWLQEYLPKLAIALMAKLPQMPILVDDLMPATHIQSLELVCPGSPITVIPHLSPCRVRKLWCASNPVYRGWYASDWSSAWQGMLTDPRNFATAITKLKELASEAIKDPTGWDRVLLARKPTRHKKLVNHLEIEAAAANRGFKVVYPEDLPFAEQVRLAHHARHIIAPDGSNGLLSYFARPGAKVCVLNPPHTLPLVELDGLLAALGAELTVFTGPVVGKPKDEPFWNDYTIDERRFVAFLDDWLADRPVVG